MPTVVLDPPDDLDLMRRLAGWVGWPNPDEVLEQVRAEAKKPKKQKNAETKKTS